MSTSVRCLLILSFHFACIFNYLGQKVTLYGWLKFNRLNRFLVLHDAYGCVQARIPDERMDLAEKVKMINCESVLKIEGVVADRGENFRNEKMRTGDVEVIFLDLLKNWVRD